MLGTSAWSTATHRPAGMSPRPTVTSTSRPSVVIVPVTRRLVRAASEVRVAACSAVSPSIAMVRPAGTGFHTRERLLVGDRPQFYVVGEAGDCPLTATSEVMTKKASSRSRANAESIISRVDRSVTVEDVMVAVPLVSAQVRR